MVRHLTGRSAARSAGRTRNGAELQELLSTVPDRPDLERLFQRKVGLPQILRLTGRDVGRGRISDLLTSEDLRTDLRKLLDS